LTALKATVKDVRSVAKSKGWRSIVLNYLKRVTESATSESLGPTRERENPQVLVWGKGDDEKKASRKREREVAEALTSPNQRTGAKSDK
jgi:hypothetical protein